jgi:hypothetical protein
MTSSSSHPNFYLKFGAYFRSHRRSKVRHTKPKKSCESVLREKCGLYKSVISQGSSLGLAPPTLTPVKYMLLLIPKRNRIVPYPLRTGRFPNTLELQGEFLLRNAADFLRRG